MPDTIQYAEFQMTSDSYILKLNAITNILSIQSYNDVVLGEIPGTSVLVRDFRYSTNGGNTYTAWATLTDLALQAISVTLTQSILFEFRYVRSDSGYNPSVIRLKEFLLDNIQVEEHVVLRVNRAVYDSVYGTQKYLDILAALDSLNTWSLAAQNVFTYIKDDNTVSGQNILIDNVLSSTVRDIDFNILLRTEYGKRLIKMFNDLDINPNNPRS
jgi:hypothetical protein